MSEDPDLPLPQEFLDVLGQPIAPGDVLVCPRNTTIMFALVDNISLGVVWVRTVRVGDTVVEGAPVRRLRLRTHEEVYNMGPGQVF